MEVSCRIELLGKLQIRQSGRTIARFRTYKTGVLLAHLAYYPDRPHPREQLIDLLWPDCESAQGRNSLSQAISSLRNQLEPPGVPAGAILIADRATVRLNPDGFVSDVSEFLSDLRKAGDGRERSEAGTPAVSYLLSAVERYGGELLPGFYEDWILSERERLRESYLRALDILQAHWESAGEIDRAIGCARLALEADPLRELSHEALIRLYVGTGERSAALRHFQDLERLLEKELGVSPSASIRALLDEGDAVAQKVTSTVGSIPAMTASSAELVPSDGAPGIVTLLLTEPPIDEADKNGLLELVRRHGGRICRSGTDIWIGVFNRASDSVEAVVSAAQSRQADDPSRFALFTTEVGEADRAAILSDRDLLRAMRLLKAAHPGQILCSEGTAALLRWDLDPGIRIVDLGVYRLAGEEAPESLFEIEHPARSLAAFPPPNALPGVTSNLPVQLTHFFGREAEIAWLLDSAGLVRSVEPDDTVNDKVELTGARLITITGPGGTGKTRLVVELARRLMPTLQGSIWFVPLADISEPHLIPRAILDALHITCSPNADPVQQAAAVLARQPALLILDNYEQLLGSIEDAEKSVQVVRALLEAVPRLICLVTSRRLLGIIGERELPLLPLPTPQAEDAETLEALSLCESVQLFVNRAQIVRPDFQVTEGNAGAIASLCQHLEGIPLALELAAARSQVLTPGQILAKLTHRLDFLVSRQPDRPARHRTLRAAVDWSYDTLPPDVQRFFARLSVFRGGFTLEAAEAICEEPLALDHLALLRECSLALARADDIDAGIIRFYLLETLREYGEEKLAPEERTATEQRHTEFYLEMAEEADREISGAGQSSALKRLDADHENLRAALNRLVQTRDAERATRMVCAMGTYWGIRGHIREARERFAAVLQMPVTPQYTRAGARARDLAGTFALNQGDFAEARRLYQESLGVYRMIGDRQGIGDQLRSLGALAFEECDYPAARALWEECLEVFRTEGNERSIAIAQKDLAYARSRLGDYESAIPLFEEALRFFRPLGRHTGTAVVLIYYADALREKGDFEAARPLCEESLQIFREVGNQGGAAMSLLTLADVLCEQGELDRAEALCDESQTIYKEMGDKDGTADVLYCRGKVALRKRDLRASNMFLRQSLKQHRELGSKVSISRCLDGLSQIAVQCGQPENAALLSAASDVLRTSSGSARCPTEEAAYRRCLAAIADEIGEGQIVAISHAILRLTPDDALDQALAASSHLAGV